MPGLNCYLSLGANLGDARGTLQSACQALAHLPQSQLLAVSNFYRSAPLQACGPDFINAVALLETTLAPLALLSAIQAIEAKHGRRRPYPNAPRTLDIDILLYGEQCWTLPELQIPHPRMAERAFVLQPLAEIAPAELPVLGRIAPLLQRVANQPIQKLAADASLII